MIISIIINRINNIKDKKKRDNIVGGLVGGIVCGLVWGFVGGLVLGLVGGIVCGLVWGLVGGLVWGLVGGIVCGLVWGFVCGLVGGIVCGIIKITIIYPFFINIWLIILIIIITLEILYLFDKSKPKKKENIFWFVVARKLEALFETLIILVNINNIRYLISLIDFNKYLPEIIRWIGYIGIGIVCIVIVLGILWLYIKLNMLKYRKV